MPDPAPAPSPSTSRRLSGAARRGGIALLAAALCASCTMPDRATAPTGKRSASIDAAAMLRQHFGNDAPWYADNIPLFESSDPLLDRVYYYRWKVYRAHQRDLGPDGYVTTEFLDDVDWQRQPYATISAAMHHHVAEGRWLRDRRYLSDYVDYMYDRGGIDGRYSEAVAAAVWGRYQVDGDRAVVDRLDEMQRVYASWDDHFDASKGLYWIEPVEDATENTIASIDASGGTDGFTGGDAFRPSINSYMVANARAIADVADLAGKPAIAARYRAKANALGQRINAALWNDGFAHYVDRFKVDNAHVDYWEPIRGRELVGYVPWVYGVPGDTPATGAAWRHLLDPARLGGSTGPRTVEPSYQYYMRQYRFDAATGQPECQWNGPSWPFQTTQVLVAMANLLNDYRAHPVRPADYVRLLRQYAALHEQDGRLDLEENYYPDRPGPIVGLDRSHHYNHSTFADLVISGLVGLRPRADDVLEVNPLLPTNPADPQYLRYFTLQDVPYHGRRVTIRFDADGSRYGRKGLSVAIDGREVASSPTLRRMTVPIERRANPAVAAPIDLAASLAPDRFPRASASVNTGAAAVHDAIDGRVSFFTELPNGWSTAGAQGDQWFAVDFGKPVDTASAELAFAGVGEQIAPPARYRIQAWHDGGWHDVAASRAIPVANGIDTVRWAPRRTTRLRIMLTPQPGRAVRLVEFKAFG